MNNKRVIIDRDLEVIIVEIKQYHTYRNLLEGIPNSKLNKIILERTISDAKELFNLQNIHLIEPILTPIEYEGNYPFGNTESLPEITCLAELKCHSAFKNEEMDYSGLGLVWFQGNYAFPIEKAINDFIKTIPYRKICEEFSYSDM
ncbi:hypothetical protein BWR22_06190 [Lacinutrix venerupis]|uniref:Uncharacterized protein n=1 Tax=Lacinutrix venerupis TaxID=1486034 RepID=A0AAC9LK38_9FLAO|nr:hypothetical protein BWR22_06190 [Lacinutrix venerupis]